MKIKLNAFTVMELLVVLILSGILMAITTGVFYNIQLYQRQIDNRAKPVNERQKIDYLLQGDLSASEMIWLENVEMICVNNQDTIYYNFEDEFIRRQQKSQVDTFLIHNEVNMVVEIEGLLARFELMLSDKEGQVYQYAYQKNYGAVQYFKDRNEQ